MTFKQNSQSILLAVNGTLMRGLELNDNLKTLGATFVREAKTQPCYRLWSIEDRYPAMQRVQERGSAIALEIWRIPSANLGTLLLKEPPGLCLGKVQLATGETVIGVLGEGICSHYGTEITGWGGWRAYLNGKQSSQSKISTI